MSRLRRVARNVADLAAAQRFYSALGLQTFEPAREDPELANVLGLARVISLKLQLGAQILELTQCEPRGAEYRAGVRSDDVRFQHIALVTQDIFAAARQALDAGATAISTSGPQKLPAQSGGVLAWKFRSPEGHPLEYLQFPGRENLAGYDHSAICVTDMARAITFYREIGLYLGIRQQNHDPEQAHLDGFAGAAPEVATMLLQTEPHVELLCYVGTRPCANLPQLNDIAADRLVFDGAEGRLAVTRDVDGHLLLWDGRQEAALF